MSAPDFVEPRRSPTGARGAPRVASAETRSYCLSSAMFRFAKQDADGPFGAAWRGVRRAALTCAALSAATLLLVSSGCTEEVRLGRVLSLDSGAPTAPANAGAAGSGGQPLFPLGGSG